MKKYILFTVLFISISFAQQEIVIKNISIISMANNKPTLNSVHIKNGEIVAINKFKKIKFSKKATIINGENKFLIPGLADMHVHLPKINQMDSVINYNLKAGVTRLRVMNSEDEQIDIKNSLLNKTKKPILYYSSIISKNSKLSDIQIDSLFNSIKTNNLNFIKIISLPSEEFFGKIMEKANENNVIVCGHYPAFAEFGKGKKIESEKVLTSTYKSIEHLGGYDALKNEKLINAIQTTKNNTIFNCPTSDWEAIAYDYLSKNELQERYTYKLFKNKFGNYWDKKYDNYIAENGGFEKHTETVKAYKSYIETKRNILKQMANNGNLLLIGSDPSNFYQLPGYNVYEEMFQWNAIGIDNLTILQAATINAAKFFNEEKTWGTIEVGKKADLNILSKNPLLDIKNITTIENTILNGQILE